MKRIERIILSRGSMRSVCGAHGTRECAGWGLFLINFYFLIVNIENILKKKKIFVQKYFLSPIYFDGIS